MFAMMLRHSTFTQDGQTTRQCRFECGVSENEQGKRRVSARGDRTIFKLSAARHKTRQDLMDRCGLCLNPLRQIPR